MSACEKGETRAALKKANPQNGLRIDKHNPNDYLKTV